MHMFPAEVKEDNILSSCFHRHHVKMGPFHGVLSVMSVAFLCFLLVTLPCKMCPRRVLDCSLSPVNTSRLWCLKGKIHEISFVHA